MDKAKREAIISETTLEDFIEEIEESICLPSGLLIHCPEQCDIESLAKELNQKIDSAIMSIVKEVEDNLEDGNYLEWAYKCNYEIDKNNIILKLNHFNIEEYGYNVELHEEFFDLDDVIEKVILNVASEKEIGSELKYEGLLSWTQIWGEEYNYTSLIGNTKENKYAKKLILEDEVFWADYEDIFDDGEEWD